MPPMRRSLQSEFATNSKSRPADPASRELEEGDLCRRFNSRNEAYGTTALGRKADDGRMLDWNEGRPREPLSGMSVVGGRSEDSCSYRVFLSLTPELNSVSDACSPVG